MSLSFAEKAIFLYHKDILIWSTRISQNLDLFVCCRVIARSEISCSLPFLLLNPFILATFYVSYSGIIIKSGKKVT